MPTLICLDTNAWFSESLLRSSVGAAVLYALRNSGDRILLPEVVEHELCSLVTRNCRNLLDAVEEARRKITELTGKHAGIDAPIDDSHIRRSVQERFAELGGLIERLKTPSDAFERAFGRVIESRLPNFEKNQQAKDSLLWECILSLGSDADVVLVSADKGFYESREIKLGLAKDLAKEAEEKLSSLKLFAGCGELLLSLPTESPKIDRELVSAALEKVLPSLMDSAVYRLTNGREEIVSWAKQSEQLALYFTANPNEITVVFRLWTTIATGDNPGPGELFIEGRTTYFSDLDSCAEPTIGFLKSANRGMHISSGNSLNKFLGHELKSEPVAHELLIPLERVQAALKKTRSAD